MDDLTGRVTNDMVKNPMADQYEIVEFPAILDAEDADGKPIQKPLWPEFFDLPALERTKASMPAFQWNSQYQQTAHSPKQRRLLSASGGIYGPRMTHRQP